MKKIINSFEEFLASSTPQHFAVTHNGVFHCDDVFSAVLLDELMHGNLILIRVSSIPQNLDLKNLMIFDIGGGKFDHHYANAPVRKCGVKYSSIGLLWKEFGRKLLKKRGVPINSINPVWNKIDKEFIQAIDASDNGELKTSFPSFSIAREIANFNPIWDLEEESNDCFEKAFQIAKINFDNIIENEMAIARAKESIEKAISKSKNGIMILPQYIPWFNYLKNSKNPERKNIQYVIFPNSRNNFYNIQTTPYSKQLFPVKWGGLKKEELRELTKIPSINFCHPKRYICETETLEDAIYLASLASNS